MNFGDTCHETRRHLKLDKLYLITKKVVVLAGLLSSASCHLSKHEEVIWPQSSWRSKLKRGNLASADFVSDAEVFVRPSPQFAGYAHESH
jgi:hypothetical protein